MRILKLDADVFAVNQAALGNPFAEAAHGVVKRFVSDELHDADFLHLLCGICSGGGRFSRRRSYRRFFLAAGEEPCAEAKSERGFEKRAARQINGGVVGMAAGVCSTVGPVHDVFLSCLESEALWPMKEGTRFVGRLGFRWASRWRGGGPETQKSPQRSAGFPKKLLRRSRPTRFSA